MTKDEVLKMLQDFSATAADKAKESLEKTEQVRADHGEAAIMEAIHKAGETSYKTPSQSEKGLDFVRCVKAIVVGKSMGQSAATTAKQMGMSDVVVKALQEQTLIDGGALVPDQFATDFIELLRAKTVVLESGARVLEFKGSMSLGRQNSAATASYLGETQAATASQPGFGQLQLSAKKLMAFVPVSNDLLRNPSASAEALVRDDLVRVMALRRDLALIRGDGNQYTPKGILNWTAAAQVTAMTGSGTLSDKVNDLGNSIYNVEAANVGMSNCGWLMHPRTKWALLKQLDSYGHFVFKDEMAMGTLFGYPFKTTTQIPINLTPGTGSELYFGDFSECMFGQETAMAIDLFTGPSFTDASSNQVNGIQSDQSVIRSLERHDFAVRHNQAFSVVNALTWT